MNDFILDEDINGEMGYVLATLHTALQVNCVVVCGCVVVCLCFEIFTSFFFFFILDCYTIGD